MAYLALQQIWRPMSQGQSETSLHFRAESVCHPTSDIGARHRQV